ncbi:MAG: tRNA lysidine(34) synthetase TilS [Clostridiales bacterium]|nr:tRNA lysidine(34) synthetase TilS [Clostridiales bacterium]
MTQRQRRLIGEKELAACGCGPENKVLVACSGGADSTALLLSMHELLTEGRIGGLFAAHLNHGIRGETAERDRRFCEALCAELAVPVATETADVPAYAKAHGQTLEQAAREVRYAFLERARAAFGADVIATAHHRDDQAETVLLHLIRGSSAAGLGGMKPRNGRIARPMLNVSRKEILSYLNERGAAYCEDETNAENGAARNRVRNELMPLLGTYNPAIADALCKTAALLAEDDAYLSALADEAEQAISLGSGLGRAGLGALAAPVGSRVVRKRLFALAGNVSEADIRRVLALASARTGTRIELPGGYHAWTDAEALYIGVYPETAEYETPFVREGETKTPLGTLVSKRVANWRKPANGDEAFLDAGALPQTLVVRSRKDGDRFYPLGAPGERKLSDVFTDRKIPKASRNLPLLCNESEVYYATGLTVSERAKVTPETREILHIMFHRGDRD